MADKIFIETGDISCFLLRNTVNSLEEAQSKLRAAENISNATYNGPDGYCLRLFPSSVQSEISSLLKELGNLQDDLNFCGNVLDFAPLRFMDIDNSYKNRLTDWWTRTSYSTATTVGALFGLKKTLLREKRR